MANSVLGEQHGGACTQTAQKKKDELSLRYAAAEFTKSSNPVNTAFRTNAMQRKRLRTNKLPEKPAHFHNLKRTRTSSLPATGDDADTRFLRQTGQFRGKRG
jgi:hypothetical protein